MASSGQEGRCLVCGTSSELGGDWAVSWFAPLGQPPVSSIRTMRDNRMPRLPPRVQHPQPNGPGCLDECKYGGDVGIGEMPGESRHMRARRRRDTSGANPPQKLGIGFGPNRPGVIQRRRPPQPVDRSQPPQRLALQVAPVAAPAEPVIDDTTPRDHDRIVRVCRGNQGTRRRSGPERHPRWPRDAQPQQTGGDADHPSRVQWLSDYQTKRPVRRGAVSFSRCAATP